MLRIVAVHLRGMGLRYAVIDGTVAPKHRMDLVEEFNTNARGPQASLRPHGPTRVSFRGTGGLVEG